MRYLIWWVVCLSCVMWSKEGGLSASEWTCTAFHDPNSVVLSEVPSTVYLRQTGVEDDIRVELADPLNRVAAKDVSIGGYLAALHKNNANLRHDIAMLLWGKYTTMVDSYTKARLRMFLENIAQDLVDEAKQSFQRDYILLWQVYVFFVENFPLSVENENPSINKSPFLGYSEKAFNLANAHEDQTRAMFVVLIFTDRLVSTFGKSDTNRIINLALSQSIDCRFLKCAKARFLKIKTNLTPPPSYKEALSTLPPKYSDSIR